MKKRIVFLTTHHWNDAFGGAEYQIKLIIEQVRDLYDIYYIARNITCETKFNNKKIKLINIPHSCFMDRFGNSYFLDSLNIYNTLKIINPDIIYQRVHTAYTGIIAYYANKYNKTMIWHISSDNDVKPWEFNLKKQIIFDYIDKRVADYGIRNCSKIIGQTKEQNELLKKYYNRKCEVIISNFHPLPAHEIQKKHPVKILWVSNIKSIKRPEIFVEVAKHFEQFPNVKFCMIGGKQNKKLTTQLEEEINKIKNLEYLGEKTLNEVNNLFCQAHIFINTSDSEGFPNTFIQAWMRRVPVVSLNVDPDNVLKNHGIGFHSGSLEQLFKDTKRLIEDEELRETMGKRAQEYAFKHHSLANIENIVDLFDK